MKQLKTVAASLALLGALTAPVYAQSAQEVLPLSTDKIETDRTFGKWAILRNETRGHCLGTKADDSGVVQMGITADETLGYVGVFVKPEVDPGKSNDVAVLVGGEVFVGESSGPVAHLGDGWHGGYILADNPDFRKAIEASNEMDVFPDQPFAVRLNIKGADKAIYEIAKCSREMGS